MTIDGKYYTTVKDIVPAIGDVRISFLIVDPDKYNEITVLAKQTESTFAEYKLDNATQNGKMANYLYDGQLDENAIKGKIKEEGNGIAMFFYVLAIIVLIPIALVIKNAKKEI